MESMNASPGATLGFADGLLVKLLFDMKNYGSKIFLLSLLALLVWSCERNETIVADPPAPKGKEFSARYIIPLTTGRPNGENTIIDAQHAELTNIAELKPVLAEVVAAAKAGKIPTYPKSDETDPKNDPKTFFSRQCDMMTSSGMLLKDEEVLVSLELEYDGQAFDGYSKMMPKYMDLTYIDQNHLLPDYNIARVYMKDLQGFKVTKGLSKIALPAYLQGRDFEHYVIRVYTPQDTFGIRTHADARTVQQNLEQGIITDIHPAY